MTSPPVEGTPLKVSGRRRVHSFHHGKDPTSKGSGLRVSAAHKFSPTGRTIKSHQECSVLRKHFDVRDNGN